LEHSEHIGKFIGPADPALIAGASKYVNPWATRAAIVPAFICFAAWYLLAICIPGYRHGGARPYDRRTPRRAHTGPRREDTSPLATAPPAGC